MSRTRQYADRVNIIKRIKIGNRWPFASVIERNGKLVRDHVLVAGQDEYHPEGHYYLEWYQDGRRPQARRKRLVPRRFAREVIEAQCKVRSYRS
jgi:hypothetical protein